MCLQGVLRRRVVEFDLLPAHGAVQVYGVHERPQHAGYSGFTACSTHGDLAIAWSALRMIFFLCYDGTYFFAKAQRKDLTGFELVKVHVLYQPWLAYVTKYCFSIR